MRLINTNSHPFSIDASLPRRVGPIFKKVWVEKEKKPRARSHLRSKQHYGFNDAFVILFLQHHSTMSRGYYCIVFYGWYNYSHSLNPNRISFCCILSLMLYTLALQQRNNYSRRSYPSIWLLLQNLSCFLLQLWFVSSSSPFFSKLQENLTIAFIVNQ